MSSGRSTFESPYSAVISTGVAVACAVGALILLMVPLPALVVDLLLAANLAGATGLLLVAVLTPRPVELTTLPSIIVLSSLARLLLALAVARLIVALGQAGQLTMTLAAVAGFNNPVASLGSLITLAVVQFVVVTAGVTRIAEVAARFALDALPGKQLALETRARTKAEASLETEDAVAHLEREANFYGAMDGAARFLRGETIAVVAIVVLTPLVRLGAAGLGGSAWENLALTVAGHGLIILVPALLVGAAAAIMVARASSTSDLTAEAGRQFFGSPVAVLGVAIACLLLALVPGVAKLPLLFVAAGLGIWGWLIAVRGAQREAPAHAHPQPVAEGAATVATGPQLQLGWGLLDLLSDDAASLLNQLARVRRELSEQLGFGLPALIVRDSEKLDFDQYAFVVRGIILDTGRLRPARQLAVADQPEMLPEEGVLVELPDGRYGKWVRPDEGGHISGDALKLLQPEEALVAHLTWVLRKHAADLFDTERASELLDQLAQTHGATVAEARSAGLTPATLVGVGRELLSQGLALTDRVALVEVLTTGLAQAAAPAALVAMTRQAMAPATTQAIAPDGTIRAITLGPQVEQELLAASRHQPKATPPVLDPDEAERWRHLLETLVARHRRVDRPLVLLCSAEIRAGLGELARSLVPALVVLEPNEIGGEPQIENVHTIVTEELGGATE